MRSPLLHFAALGALLFVVRHVWSAPATVPMSDTIVVPAAPDPAQVEAAIDDEVLYREALAHEVDRRDQMVRARLIRLGRFLGLAPGGDDDALEREARRIGLQRTDVFVRRHLVEMMRLAGSHTGRADLPDDQTLSAYYDQRAERFAQPERVRLTQVYLSRDRRGDATEHDATDLLAALRRRAAGPEAAETAGDPFVNGASIPLASQAQLERLFGPDFASAAFSLPERTWSGPVPSPYGLHLVWVEERRAASKPPLAVVRNRVLHEFLHDRGEARLAATLRGWRAHYDIRVEPVNAKALAARGLPTSGADSEATPW